MASGRTRAIAAATAASSVVSRSALVKVTVSWAAPQASATAAPSCPRAPTTAIRISGGLRGIAGRERLHLRVVEDAFPPSDDHRGNAVTHDVHGRSPHVEDLVDAEEDGGALEREAELCERRREDDQRGAGHARHTLAGEHQRQHHDELLAEGHWHASQLSDEDTGQREVQRRAVEIEAVTGRQHEPHDVLRHAEAFHHLERLRQRGLRARGGERDEEWFTNRLDEGEERDADQV